MHLPSWRQIVARIATWKTGVSLINRERRDFARLSLRRLEDRRVLNGTPLSMGISITDAKGAVIVDASQDAGTGHSFDMSLNSNNGKIDLELTDHGTILYEEEINKIASVTFLASGSNDSLTVDFGNGDPIPSGGVAFFVSGGAQQGLPGDSLQLVNGAAGTVAYSLSNPASGLVSIDVGSQHSSIAFSGATQVSDGLIAAARSFSIGGASPAAELLSTGPAVGMSQLNISQLGLAAETSIDFANPTQSLSVNDSQLGPAIIDVQGLATGFDATLSISAASASTIDLSGPLNLVNGSLSITAGTIEVDSPIATNGGTIELSATEQINIAPSGSLSTTAAAISVAAPQITQQGLLTAADGGTVSLDAGTDGTLLDSGTIDASTTVAGHTGGSVELLGQYVALTGQAVVNVSGSAGGGSVFVGGGYHGTNSAVLNAAKTYVGQEVTIEANAIDSGDGGRITVWSQEATWFYGRIESRGGALGGNGGFAEVSSHANLTEQGVADLSAPRGQLGSLLLDPLTITIVHAGSASQDGNLPTVNFNDTSPTPPTSDFSISDTALAASSTNILLQAANSITINDLGGVLALQSGVNITLETRNGSGDSATGGITFLNTANTLKTQGSGTITIVAGVNAAIDGTFTQADFQGTADANVGGLQTDATGAITVVASRNIVVDGAVNSSGATVNFNADSRGIQSGTFQLTLAGSVNSAHGTLNITAADVSLPGNLTGGTVTFQTNAVETMGIGNESAGMQITNGALSRITADSLVIGGFQASSVTGNAVGLSSLANIGAVTLRSLATGGTIGFDGSVSEFNTLTLNANSSAGTNADLITHGVLTINADAGGLGTGTFFVAAGASIDTNNHLLDITTADTVIVGTTSSGSATTKIHTAVNESFQIGNFNTQPHIGIGRSGLSHITADTLIVGDGNMTGIAVDGVLESDSAHIGTLVLQALAAGANINFLNNSSTFQALTATAQNQITFTSGQTLTAVAGGITLTGTTVGIGITDTGDLTLLATSGVTLNSSLATGTTTTGAGLSINADTAATGIGAFSLVSGGSINTNGNALSITAAGLSLTGADTLNSGSAATAIKASDDETVGLGAATGTLTIDATVLANSTFGSLVIGGTTTSDITADGVTATQGPVTLNAQSAGAKLTFTGGTESFQKLTGNATTDLKIDAVIDSPGDVFLKSLGTMTFTSNGTIDTSPGTTGTLTVNGGFAINGDVTVGAGNITLIALGAGSDLTINGNLTTPSTMSLSAPRDIIVSKTITTTLGTADINLTADVNNTGSGGVWVTATGNVDSGRNITISGSQIFTTPRPHATDPSGTSGASIQIDANSGSPTNDQIVAAGSITLTSGGAAPAGSDIILNGVVRSTGAGSVDVTAQHDIQTSTTIASAGGNIGFHSPVILNGATTVNSAGGNIKFDGTIDSAAATANDLTLTAGAGDITLTGAVGLGQPLGNLLVTSSHNFLASSAIQAQSVSVTSTNNVTFNGNVTTTGTITVNADSDANDSGAFIVADGAVVKTNGNALSITAARITLGATSKLNSGAATTTIQASDDETIGLGNGLVSGAQNIQLNNNNLANITSQALTIGGGKTGTITVATAVTGATQGPVTLNAGNNTAGTDVVFTGGASSFQALDVTAHDQIQLGATVNATGAIPPAGDIVFHTQTFVTAPSAVTTAGGNVTFSNTVDSKTATAEGLTITAGAGDVTFTGAVGSTNPLAALSVVSSHNFLESNGIQAQSVNVSATNDVTFTGLVATVAGGTGAVTVFADSDQTGTGHFTETNGIDTSAVNGAVSIKAEQVSLAGTVKSGTVATKIEATQGLTIGLGSGAGHIQITQTELNLINSGSLTIGGANTGTITSDSATTTTQQGPVTLNAGNSTAGTDVVFSGGASSFQALDVTAHDQIQLGTTVNATGTIPPAGDIVFHSQTFLTSPSAVTTAGGNVTFSSTVDSQTATAEGLTITAGAGDVTFTGAVGVTAHALAALSVVSSHNFLESNGIQAQSISVNATNDVTFTGLVATVAGGAGTVTVFADSDQAGTGKFTETNGVDTSAVNGAVSIKAEQVSLVGSVKSGTAATRIEATQGLTIGLGDGAGAVAAHIHLSQAELNLIHSGSLTIGGTNTGTITSDTATTGTQQGPVTLNAGNNTAGTDVVFSGGASSFQALDVTAHDQIQLGATVNTTGAIPPAGDIVFHTQTFVTAPSVVTTAGGNVTFSSTVDSKTATAEGLTITAGAGDVTFTGAVGSTNPLAALSVVSSHNFLESNGIQAQSVSVSATNDVTFTGLVATVAGGAGAVTVFADSDQTGTGQFTETNGVDTSAVNGAVSIKAEQVSLVGTVKSGTAATKIEATQGKSIGLGSGAGHIQITQTELNLINSGSLTIGGANTGTITSDSATTTTQQGPVTLNAGNNAVGTDVVFSGGASSFQALDVTAHDQIQLGTTVNTTGTIPPAGDIVFHTQTFLTAPSAVTTAGGNVTFSSTVDSQTATAEGLTITAGAGDVTFTGAVGVTAHALAALSVVSSHNFLESNGIKAQSISVNATNDVTFTGLVATVAGGTGAATVFADSDQTGTGKFTETNGIDTSAVNGAVSIKAEQLSLVGTVKSGTAATRIEATQGLSIGLGAGAGHIQITQTELNLIHSGSLTIGGVNTGTITSAAATTGTQQGPVTLNAGNNAAGTDVVFTGGASSFQSLDVTAFDQIQLGATVHATGISPAGDIVFHTQTFVTAASTVTTVSGNITFSSTVDSQTATPEGLTVTAVTGDVTFTGDVGATNPLGALNATSTNNVTFDGNVTTRDKVTVTADSDANGAGAFILAASKSIQTNNNSLTITTASMTLNSSQTLNSGTASTTIEASAGETIGLNDASENITVDATVLSNIHSGGLALGGATTGSIVVGGITATQSAQVGPVTLTATSTALSAADITFSGDSTFGSAAAGINAIKATAAHDVNVNANIVTSPAGDVFLEAGNNLTIKNNPGGGSITTAGVSGGKLTVDGGISVHDVTVGAGNVTLIAHAPNVDLIVANVTVGGSIELDAPRDIIVEGTIKATTGSSSITLIGDVANTGTGGVWITAAGNLIAGANVTIEGSNLFHRTAASLNPTVTTPDLPAAFPLLSVEVANNTDVVPTNPIVAAGNITIQNNSAAPAGSVIDLQGVLQSTGTGNIDLTATTLASQYAIHTNSLMETNGGNISVDSPVVLTGTTTLTTNGAGGIKFNNGGAVTANATIDSLDSVTPQTLNLTAGTGGITLSADVGGQHPLGTLTADAANGVTFNANVTTNGVLSVNADTDGSGAGTFSIGPGAAVNTTSHAANIVAQDVTLAVAPGLLGTLNTGTATTTITTQQNETIGLGNTAGDLTISGAELQNITTNDLVLGGSTTKAMTVNGITQAQSANIVTTSLNALNAGASISFLTGDSTFHNLVATADNNIVFGPGRTLTAGGQTPGTGFATGTESLTLTAQNGAITDTGALTLDAVDGVTLNSSLTTGTAASGTGTLLINADTDNNGTGTLTLAAGQTINTNNSNLTAQFDTLTLAGTLATTLDSGSATTTLAPTHLATIGVGLATGHFTVDSTLLNKITAQNLTIGGTQNGNITVDGFVSAATGGYAIPGTITLLAETTNAGISFVNHASTFDDLVAKADNGIQVQQNLTTVGATNVNGDLNLDGDADNTSASSSPADSIVFSPGVVVTAGGPAGNGTITLAAKTGLMSDTGALTLDAKNGVTINSNLTTGTGGSGGLTINADTDANQTGTFKVSTLGYGAAVNSSNNALDITAADVVLNESNTASLQGTLSSGTATMHLHTSVSTETIGIGATENFSLSNAEMGNIINTTGVVTIGDLTDTGDVHIATSEPVIGHGPTLTSNLTLNLTVLTGTNIKLDENDAGHNLETTGNLTLTADGDNNGTGAITGGKGHVGANLLTLSAAQGIGNNQNGPGFNTAASTIDAVNTGTGVIALNQTADATIGHATGDLIIDRVALDRANGQFISITTTGQLIEGTSPIAGQQNIIGPTLELVTQTGIGSSGNNFLQTDVSTLALVNSTSGNVQINNIASTGGGALVIGTVDPGTFTPVTTVTTKTVGIQNTGGGQVFLINTGPMTINNNVANAGGGDTILTTNDGAANDLTINALIDATHGNGSLYFNAGSSLLINDSGNGSSNTPDIEAQGTGRIVGVAQNQVVLASNVLIQTDQGGNIGFSAISSDLTSSARIYDTGGSGTILLFAGNNLNLNDSGFAVDMWAQGTGKILGFAENSVNYGTNVMLKTDTSFAATPGPGTITTLFPTIQTNVFAPEIDVNGNASVSGSFGDPGTQSYMVIVNWHDGPDRAELGQAPVDTYFFTGPTNFHFTNHFTQFPNKVDQSAPIPISITVVTDPNIFLIGAQQAPITIPQDRSLVIPGEKDLLVLGNGFQAAQSLAVVSADLIAAENLLNNTLRPTASPFTLSPAASPGISAFVNTAALASLIAQENALISLLNPSGFPFENPVEPEFTGPQTSQYLTFAQVPGNGLGIISIDSNIYITVFHSSPPAAASILPTGATPQTSQSQSETTVAQQPDATNAEERQVIIEALNADGSPLLDADGKAIQVRLSDTVLDDLDKLFENLPDGRYKISVIEPGELKARTLLDINLRGHKQADVSEEGEGKPPASDQGAPATDAGNPQAALPARPLPTDAFGISRDPALVSPWLTAGADDLRIAALTAATPVDIDPVDAASQHPAAGRAGADANADTGVDNRQDGKLPAAARSPSRHGPARSVAETALGLGALAAVAGRNWEERVDAALAEAGAGSLSKTARLARRLLRPAEKTARRTIQKLGSRQA